MPPPVHTFPVRELQEYTRTTAEGKWRKGFDGDLGKCEGLGMVQYRCEVDKPGERNSVVRCWPVERFFRR